MTQYKPLVLVIIDGFGVSPDKVGSPWETASHPVFSEIEKFYPFTTLQASGIAVGLPWGEAGNSEVGHLTIGAGRIIYNYLPKISTSINDGSFFKNSAFLNTAKHTKDNNSNLHIMGLFSSGTVHAYYQHLYALLDFAKQNEIKNVYLHLFTDGKDAYKKEGAGFYENFEKKLKEKYTNTKIASIVGRGLPMNRDGSWEKTEKAYNLFTKGGENEFEKASLYIKNQYSQEIFDEAIKPAISKEIKTESRIKDNDAVVFFNFREDSPRQLTEAFVKEDFSDFNREKINNLFFVTMTEYDKNLPSVAAFESAQVKTPLAKIIKENGFSQFHIAETEKYAHVTYFFNGGEEKPFEKEDRMLIESPDVPSYDQAPEMSADKVTEAVISKLNNYDFIVVNFANADMVGHTGKFEATSRALEVIDSCIGKILTKVLELNGCLIITSDHGNAEEKIYKKTGEDRSEHSINPVPFYLINNDVNKRTPLEEEAIKKEYATAKGTLTDVSPTILELLNFEKPDSMTGSSLLDKLVPNDNLKTE